MKKKIALVMACAMTVASLAGCGGGSDDSSNSSSGDTSSSRR